MSENSDKDVFLFVPLVFGLFVGFTVGVYAGCGGARDRHCRALTGESLYRVDNHGRIICQVLQDAPEKAETPAR